MPVGTRYGAIVAYLPNTVLRELKKKEVALESVNTSVLRTLNPDEVAWDIERAGEAEAEMDEMWSCVGNKGNPRALACHRALHRQGLGLCLWRRQDTVFLKLKALLEPFGITRYIRIIGVPTHGISTPLTTAQASGIRRRSSASI